MDMLKYYGQNISQIKTDDFFYNFWPNCVALNVRRRSDTGINSGNCSFLSKQLLVYTWIIVYYPCLNQTKQQTLKR